MNLYFTNFIGQWAVIKDIRALYEEGRSNYNAQSDTLIKIPPLQDAIPIMMDLGYCTAPPDDPNEFDIIEYKRGQAGIINGLLHQISIAMLSQTLPNSIFGIRAIGKKKHEEQEAETAREEEFAESQENWHRSQMMQITTAMLPISLQPYHKFGDFHGSAGYTYLDLPDAALIRLEWNAGLFNPIDQAIFLPAMTEGEIRGEVRDCSFRYAEESDEEPAYHYHDYPLSIAIDKAISLGDTYPAAKAATQAGYLTRKAARYAQIAQEVNKIIPDSRRRLVELYYQLENLEPMEITQKIALSQVLVEILKIVGE